MSKPPFPLLSLCLAGLLSAQTAMAANYPTVSYDASYVKLTTKQNPGDKQPTPVGQSNYRFLTDGQGHIRIESEPPHEGVVTVNILPKTITIFDYPDGVSYILLEKQKVAMRSPLQKDASLAPLNDARIKELNGKALGAETRYKHPCHGWEYVLNGVKTTTWTADDLEGCPIHTESLKPDGTGEILHLASYVLWDDAKRREEFNIPSDFKISDMGFSPARNVQ